MGSALHTAETMKREHPQSDPDSSPTHRNFIGRGNDAFVCGQCGTAVAPLAAGGFRNHCPTCLWSRHVDRTPGDRSETCGALMRPTSAAHERGGWYIEHVCERCGFSRRARLSLEDPQQPDSWERLVDLTAESAPGEPL